MMSSQCRYFTEHSLQTRIYDIKIGRKKNVVLEWPARPLQHIQLRQTAS